MFMIARPLRLSSRLRPVARVARLEQVDPARWPSIVLKRQPSADADGYAGLEDKVDNHWLKLFVAAALSTILGVGSAVAYAETRGPSSKRYAAAARGA